MVNKTDTLERLNSERDYEEELAHNLTSYFLTCIDHIEDIDSECREKLRKYLKIIREESIKHNHMFSSLIQMVVEDGENNY